MGLDWMRHHSVVEWEKKLEEIFDRIDVVLEKKYGGDYPLHPARAEHGETSGGSYDGHFSVSGVFSAGFGSEHKEGYIVRIQMATLSDVPDDIRSRIENEVAAMLRKELPKVFPDRELRVDRDGPVYKIHGDLSLGEL